MTRFWVIAVLTFVASTAEHAQAGDDKGKDPVFQVKAKLTNNDPKDGSGTVRARPTLSR